MRVNTRFSVAIHILTVAAFCREKTVTSKLIAKSVNTNPVVIRRITALLKKAGIVEVKLGIGGISLKDSPRSITLLSIYNAVKEPEKEDLFDLHQEPNAHCPIGANIHKALATPLLTAQSQMEASLEKYTLYDVMKTVADNSSLTL